MGSIFNALLDKLKYIEETKTLIKESLKNNVINVSDDDTFRSYAQKINEIKCFTQYSYVRNSLPVLPEMSNELGEVNKYERASYFIPPRMHSSSSILLSPYSLTYVKTPSTYAAGECRYVDLSNISSDTYVLVPERFCYGNRLRTLILPDKVNLDKHCFYGNSKPSSGGFVSNTDTSNMFTSGIIFRGSTYACSSDWIGIKRSPTETHRVVLPKDFYGQLYLSKLNIFVDSMIDMFENLKDLNGTGKSYTLNLGTENLAKLTEEQIDIARSKGWDIT